MSPGILTVTTPMGADADRGEIPYDVVFAYLDGDGIDERVEIETEPRLSGSAFREWRVYREGQEMPAGIAAGMDVSVVKATSGAAVVKSDGGFWTLKGQFGLQPFGDLLAGRTPYMREGTEADQKALQANGAPGIFRENVQVITVNIDGGRAAHRILAGAGFAFMDEASESSPFLITDAQNRPLFGGWSGAHPWLFRNGTGFTVVAKNRFGFQISILPEGVL